MEDVGQSNAYEGNNQRVERTTGIVEDVLFFFDGTLHDSVSYSFAVWHCESLLPVLVSLMQHSK